MTTSAHKRNTDGIAATAKEKSNKTFLRAKEALEKLQASGATVNFTTVAEEAGISITYLYKSAEFSRAIKDIRHAQESDTSFRRKTRNPRSEASNAAIADALRLKVKQLEEEITKLRGVITDQNKKIEVLSGEVVGLKMSKRIKHR
jgi:predicted RNase H-like nuclease (RuvC/YqgF family)